MPDAEPAVVKRFATVADAEGWIARQKERVLSTPARPAFLRRRMGQP
jgi:hypothetical protein